MIVSLEIDNSRIKRLTGATNNNHIRGYVDTNYHTGHNSPYFGKSEEDDTYKKCNAFDNKQDYYTYKEWLKYRCGKELTIVDNFIKSRSYEISNV